MGPLYTYDFKQVQVLVGTEILTGFQEGDDAITVEYDNDDWNLVVGADGEGTRSKGNNRSATITLRFKASSGANDKLNGYYQADKLSNSGLFPIMVKDGSGRSIHAGGEAWIQKGPASNYGQNSGNREWVIRTHDLASTFGGN